MGPSSKQSIETEKYSAINTGGTSAITHNEGPSSDFNYLLVIARVYVL